MYMPNLFLFTLLAVLSGVKGAPQQKWLCYCTIQTQYDPATTQRCCATAPGVLVGPPPVGLNASSLALLSRARRRTSLTAVPESRAVPVPPKASFALQSDGMRDSNAAITGCANKEVPNIRA
ncbi:hypothetical protein DFH08DRAFT_977837 [Mycena albidolilacea]|uniref:Uncharacterized protein n=1 Tax=Mycena albidolilacea TaxID=1033008 RepID=A0AAD6Z0P1_9AGAR|nr:hypothetical protein DFH08DRAFT_977837 [Mycena albidolilacea]